MFRAKGTVWMKTNIHSWNLSFQLSTRVRNNVEQKKRWVSALSAGVSPEGQKLYMVISKTINQVNIDKSLL